MNVINWEIEEGDICYAIDDNGNVMDYLWCGLKEDIKHLKKGHLFPTKKLANVASKAVKKFINI